MSLFRKFPGHPTQSADQSDTDPKDTPQPIEPVRIAIVDDDAGAVQVLRNALRAYGDQVEICGTATSLEAARDLLREQVPDLLFLDIEFPEEESGLDLMPLQQEIGADIDIVFYTSYSKYLIQALRLQAFDFLLKPVDDEELSIIMNRYFMERDAQLRNTSFFSGNMPLVHERRDAQALAITTITNDKVIVSPSNILFFKYDSDRKVWEVVLNNLQRLILKRHTTADIILNYGPDFIRTHQSYIVNVAYLGMITNTNCTLLPPYTDITEIKISKSFRRQLLDRFYDL